MPRNRERETGRIVAFAAAASRWASMQAPPPLDPSRHALFLDFDGTLVGFRDDPQAVAIERDALGSLIALSGRLDGALAIVSGRRIEDLDRFLRPLSFAAAGVHGLELRRAPGGDVERSVDPHALDRIRGRLRDALAAHPGLRLEDKGSALVLHCREHPELEAVSRETMARAVEGETGFKIMPGNRIVEVHPAGMDKGIAVTALMREPAFDGRVPLYVGDDTTDEYAMEAVQAAGGLGVKVGPGESVGRARLADVPAVHRWLAEALGPLGRP